jgi:hydrogenase maturation protease
LGGVVESILILCTGYPYTCDTGFGYHVAEVLEKMDLPENVKCVEVGESASEFPHLIDGMDKMIVVDVFQTNAKPGTIVCLRPDEVPVTVNGVTDVAKFHLMETLEQISMSGKCPETLFIGVVPKDVETIGVQLSPEIQSKVPEVLDLIMEKINTPHLWYGSG